MKQIKLEKQVADLQKRVESLERHQGYLRQSYAELIREHNKRVCEDYTPQEPLIKDEKISYSELRKLVRIAMREAEEERTKKLAEFYTELCGEGE